jgi:hypothetical protein
VTELQKSLATMVASFLICLFVSEGVCRLLPVRSGLEVQDVDADHPVIRFRPDSDFVYSLGWQMTNVNRGRVNNDGFINNQDYHSADPRPLLAVIGDSYVEAAMVPYPLTVQGRLAAEQDDRRVYSFGSSGSSLIDYLYYAVYARQRFHPDWLVINVVGNDFDEMLLRYKQAAGFHYLTEEPDGSLAPALRDYHPSVARRMLRHSALVRYLMLNIGSTSPIIAGLLNGRVAARLTPVAPAYAADPAPPDYVGNTAARADPQRIALSQRAVVWVLDHLPQMVGLDSSHVLFLMDSYRVFDPATLAEMHTSYFGIMRDYLISQARKRGYEVQDLQEWFARRHAKDGAVFQFPDDAHWNGTGHEEAANAVRASTVYTRFTEQ